MVSSERAFCRYVANDDDDSSSTLSNNDTSLFHASPFKSSHDSQSDFEQSLAKLLDHDAPKRRLSLTTPSNDLHRQLEDVQRQLTYAKSEAEMLKDENDALQSQLIVLHTFDRKNKERMAELESELDGFKKSAKTTRSGSFGALVGNVAALLADELLTDGAPSEEKPRTKIAAADVEPRCANCRPHRPSPPKDKFQFSGLDEDDLRYAAAQERDCLKIENERLKADLERVTSERDGLKSLLATTGTLANGSPDPEPEVNAQRSLRGMIASSVQSLRDRRDNRKRTMRNPELGIPEELLWDDDERTVESTGVLTVPTYVGPSRQSTGSRT